MCNNHKDGHLCEKVMQEIRHPKEKKLFVFISILTIVTFFLILIGSFFRDEIITSLKKSTIENYLSSLSEKEKEQFSHKTPDEILAKIPAEQKENIEAFEFYYWWVVLGFPLVILILVIYQI